ncbi:MAG TPA: CoA transferase [Rugosimonospora sp.]|nr:CoA transferase [Rugosimonospora sp.]
MDDMRDGPLAGLRVLELGTLIAGPFAARLMADMGADVIKVEAPDRPDPLRQWGQASGRYRYLWAVHARNKRCVTLDLRTGRGRALLLDLVSVSDVVVESFRPGTLERWRLGYDELAAVNPGVVLARVSGYGQTGPLAARAGYASVAEALSGLRHLTGYPGQPPPRLSFSLGDSLAGLFAYQGILAALLARRRTGRGQVVDTALTEACLAILESVVPDYDQTGYVRGPSGTRLDGVAPSNLYRAADDRWVVVAANQDTVFRRLAQLMDRPELADDARYATHAARGAHQDELDALVGDWVATLPAADIVERCNAAGVVAGPVHTVADVVREPHFIDRGLFVPHPGDDGSRVLGLDALPRLSLTPGRVRWAGPAVPGAHNKEVFTELLGLDDTVLAGLAAEGII